MELRSKVFSVEWPVCILGVLLDTDSSQFLVSKNGSPFALEKLGQIGVIAGKTRQTTERKRCTPAHWGLENRRMEYSKSRCQNSALGKNI